MANAVYGPRSIEYSAGNGQMHIDAPTRAAPSHGPSIGAVRYNAPTRAARSQQHNARLNASAPALTAQLAKLEDLKLVSEAAYLYGFVDPDFAERGPANSEYPTETICFHSKTLITVQAFAADTAAYPSNTALGMVDVVTNGLCVVCTPYLCQDFIPPSGGRGRGTRPVLTRKRGGGYNVSTVSTNGDVATTLTSATTSHLAQGYTYSSEIDPLYNTPLFHAGGSVYQPPQPFGLFDSPFPGLDTTVTDAEFGQGSVPYRCIGFRSTLLVTTPDLTASGMVFGGDNGDYYEDVPKAVYQVDSSGNENPAFEQIDQAANPLINPGILGFGQFNQLRRVRELGSFSNSACYESCWLPNNDRALDFIDYFSTHVYDTTPPQAVGTWVPPSTEDSALQDLANYPCNIFFLRGIAVGSTFEVSTTFCVEIAIATNSLLAFMVNSARFMPRFFVDWTMFANIFPANSLAGMVKEWSMGSYGGVGLAAATGRIDVDEGRRPMAQGSQGALPATASLTATVDRWGDRLSQYAGAGRIALRVGKMIGGIVGGPGGLLASAIP
jgi:hypothetical protein